LLKKALIFIFIFASTLIAFDDVQRQMYALQARIFPQILLYDNDIAQKSFNSRIVIAIVHSKNHEDDADFLKSQIHQQNAKGTPLDVILIPEENYKASISKMSGAVIIMNIKNQKAILSDLTKNNIVTFAVNDETLKNGALFGVKITDKTRILINKKTFQSGKFSLNPALLKLVKSYDEE
jgi:YfiR/HmsC-like